MGKQGTKAQSDKGTKEKQEPILAVFLGFFNFVPLCLSASVPVRTESALV